MKPAEMIDELSYRCYRANRGYTPQTTPAEWATIFGAAAVERFEVRFQAERDALDAEFQAETEEEPEGWRGGDEEREQIGA